MSVKTTKYDDLEVIITKGLPGSGKSTWARSECDAGLGKYKLVSKDDLRAMLDNGRFDGRVTEDFVLKIRDAIILAALADKRSVIVHDTNLAPRHIEHITQLVRGKAKVVIKDFTDVPLEDCIQRDLKRFNSVGKDVIVKMHNQYLKSKPPTWEYVDGLPDAILVDIDGTLAHMDDRRGPYNWDKVHLDRPDQVIIDLVNTFTHGYRSRYGADGKELNVIVMSGRDGSCEGLTRQWLDDHGLEYDALYMRAAKDMRKDNIVKEELFKRHVAGRYNVLFVLDDRDQVVQQWRSMGLKCLQVAEGNF